MKKFMKRLLAVLIGFFLPLALIWGFYVGIPNQYTDTYVGELSYLFKRLNATKEKKIIVVGGSSCAFGLRSDLVEQELHRPCINFGLYGTIGTKTMMALSRSNIQEGDIVVLAPEVNDQTLSLYFNPDAMIRALGGDQRMISYLDQKDQLALANVLPSYLSNNYDLYIGKANAATTGIYQRSSFNEYGDISVFRPYNIMADSYDPVSLIRFDFTMVAQEFLDYCNDYAAFVRSRKATLYFSYGPMDSDAVSSTPQVIHEFEDFLHDKLDCEIMSNAMDYIYDSDYFYDTNFHLNTSGAVLRTNQLVTDIKRVIGDNSKNTIELLPKPLKPTATTDGDETTTDDDTPATSAEGLDNSYYDDFSYQKVGSAYAIVSLKGSGQAKTELVIPCLFEGKTVNRILTSALSNAPKVQKITVQRNITLIQNGAFSGCSALREIVIQNMDPSTITVGMAGGLLSGLDPTCLVYVPKTALSLYQNDYTWEAYRSVLRGY